MRRHPLRQVGGQGDAMIVFGVNCGLNGSNEGGVGATVSRTKATACCAASTANPAPTASAITRVVRLRIG